MRARTWCPTHWARWKAHGDPYYERVRDGHSLSDIDSESMKAVCKICGVTKIVRRTGKNANGFRCKTIVNGRTKRGNTIRKEKAWPEGRHRKRAIAEHILSDIHEKTMLGTCAKCGVVPLHRQGPRLRCAIANLAAGRKSMLKYIYGLSIEDFENMLIAQDFKCACCSASFTEKRPYIDHSHVTGKVRGILCNGCNAGIGMLGDNLEGVMRAVKYLKENDVY